MLVLSLRIESCGGSPQNMSSGLVLEVLLGANRVQRVRVAGGEITIGRSPGNTVVLDDMKVSGKHATLASSADGLMLTDLGSFHGTFQKGKRVQRTVARAGDEFTVGPFTLRVLEGDADAPAEHTPHQPAPGQPAPGQHPGAAPAPAARTSRPVAVPSRLPPVDPPSSGGVEEFRHLVQGLIDLTGIVGVTDLHAVLEALLRETMKLLRGKRGFVVLTQGGTLSPVIRSLGSSPSEDGGFSRTICQQAIDRRDTVLLAGPDDQPAIEDIRSLRAARPRMVLAVPLMESDEILGILYLESDRFLGAALRDHLKLLREVSALGGRSLRAALDRQQIVGDSERWRWLATNSTDEPDLMRTCIGSAMQPVAKLVERVAAEDVTCLILGESGTGKEVVARTIHRLSRRRDGPYVAINCGAIPRDLIEGELFGAERGAFTGAAGRRPGRLELAEGGTLVLDEIGELPRDLQVKLLRVLETRTFERLGGGESVRWNARVLAATNRDLEQAVKSGDFREDLYWRLNVVTLSLPPLRERHEDLPELVSEILLATNRRFQRKLYGVAPDALAAMQAYHWPGNVRELRNVIERALVIEPGDSLSLASLPFRVPERRAGLAAGASSGPDTGAQGPSHGSSGSTAHGPSLGPSQPAPVPAPNASPAFPVDRPIPLLADFMRGQERDYIRLVLDQLGGNVTRAAQAMGLTRSALYKKLRALGLQDFRTEPGEEP